MNVLHFLPKVAKYSGKNSVVQRFFSTKSHFGCRDEDGGYTTIDKFGIVAAVSRNQVIGLNGAIPWHILQDRKIFTQLTTRAILIMGKRTFFEQPTLDHINHARCCIVVSKSLSSLENNASQNISKNPSLELVSSFPKALELAKRKCHDEDAATCQESITVAHNLQCWVVGGEQIYKEALQHPAAQELHLSTVNIHVEFGPTENVARFPSRETWAAIFEQSSPSQHFDASDGVPSFEYTVYRRKG